MIVRMKKLWLIFKHFIFSKKIWSWPRKSEVLIFDGVNKDILLEYVEPWHPEVLYVRGEQTNMMVLLKSLLRRGRGIESYIDCFIEKVQPRLVVTFIDNHSGFHSISGRHRGVKTLFVQNGLRAPEFFERLANRKSLGDSLKVNYMMTFGNCVGDEYTKYIQGCVVPMGSVKNNLIPKVQTHQKAVLAFVSQWLEKGLFMGDTFYSQEEFCRQTDLLIVQSLVRYAEENNKRLMIIPRHLKGSDLREMEEDYFRGLMMDNKKPKFFDKPGYYSNYQAIDSVEVAVMADSTLGYESIARGNKTAIFSIRGTLLGVEGFGFGWPRDSPNEGLFWTNNPDLDSFMRILDYLFTVDDMQWKEDVESTNYSSLMVYDPGNSILKATLEKELGSLPSVKNSFNFEIDH
jgi:surface carbohydrate biosynthesis protein